MNQKQALIRNRLEKLRLPFESQVAVYINNATIYWGDWIQSSGHLAYMLDRDDVNGCIGGMSATPFSTTPSTRTTGNPNLFSAGSPLIVRSFFCATGKPAAPI